MDDGDQVVIQKILAKIGQKVVFKYPGIEGTKTGVPRDRTVMRSSPDSENIPYWDVVDLIEFPEEDELRWLRIGYYRMPKPRKLVWASQTTITERVSTWKKLLVETANEKAWFRDLLNDVMKELQEME